MNAYLSEGHVLPPEYHFLRVGRVREWQPLDTACFLKVLISSLILLPLSYFSVLVVVLIQMRVSHINVSFSVTLATNYDVCVSVCMFISSQGLQLHAQHELGAGARAAAAARGSGTAGRSLGR